MSRLARCTHPALKQRYKDLQKECNHVLGAGWKKRRIPRTRTGQIKENGKTFLEHFSREVPSAARVRDECNYPVYQAMLRMLSDLNDQHVAWHMKDEAWSPEDAEDRDMFRKFLFASPHFKGVFI